MGADRGATGWKHLDHGHYVRRLDQGEEGADESLALVRFPACFSTAAGPSSARMNSLSTFSRARRYAAEASSRVAYEPVSDSVKGTVPLSLRWSRRAARSFTGERSHEHAVALVYSMQAKPPFLADSCASVPSPPKRLAVEFGRFAPNDLDVEAPACMIEMRIGEYTAAISFDDDLREFEGVINLPPTPEFERSVVCFTGTSVAELDANAREVLRHALELVLHR